jgi:hypothetical protein
MTPTDKPVDDTDPVLGVYDNHADAEAAVKALSEAGFDMKKLSIIGKGYHSEEHPMGFYSLGDRVKAWGGIGGFWGAVWGLLAAPAVFVLPRVGLIAVAGPVVLALLGALEGAAVVGGLSALCAALVSLGLSKEKAIRYELDIKADRFLVLVHGTPAEVAWARVALAAVPLPASAASTAV